MKTITYFFLVCFLLIVPYAGNSAHIVGGTYAYEVLGVNNGIANVEVTLYLYRDSKSGGAQFDSNIQLGLYKYENSEYSFIESLFVQISSFSVLEINDISDCPNDIINYEIGTYTTQIEIPLENYEHFTIGHQRCCRNPQISNIKFPEETGIAISFDLFPAAFLQVNKPIVMSNQFPVLTEVGIESSFDISVEDEFEKEYYLSIPKAAGGVLGSTIAGDPNDCEGITPDVENCQPEFDEVEYIDPDNPYGQGATIEMDKDSGIMNLEIPAISKVLVGLTVDRFSEGELLSRLRQQFLINSLDCTTSTSEYNGRSDINIWPSPTTDKVYFESKLQDVRVVDIHGKKMELNPTMQSITELDLIELPKGVYIIKGKTEEGNWVSQKIIKMD